MANYQADYQKDFANETLNVALDRLEAMAANDDLSPCPAAKEELSEIIQLIKRAKKYISNA